MLQIEKACDNAYKAMDWLAAASEVGTKTERFAALLLREELARVYAKISALLWAVQADARKGEKHE